MDLPGSLLIGVCVPGASLLAKAAKPAEEWSDWGVKILRTYILQSTISI